MKFKSMIAGLLAGVLMMGNLSAVCFAAEGAPPPTSGATETEAVETAPAETDETAGDASEDGSPALPDGVTLGTKVVLPEGVAIGEDGKITFSAQGLEQIMEALMGGDAGGDTDTEPETETVTVGTVNVRSDTYLNLRSGSGIEHSVIGHLLRGTEVEVIGESGDWYQVVVPEATGYVYKDYLDVTEQEAPTAPPTDDGQDEPPTGSGIDEDTLMMMLLLMMSMGNTDTAEPPSAALTPDGNLTLVDDYDEAHADGSGKQFITLVTKAGNTFYLIIDRDDEGEQTVHFLNLVDEADLLALMDEDTAAKYTKPEPEVQLPAETQEPEDGDGEDKPDEAKPAAKVAPLPVLVLVLALLGGGGFFAYTKFFKGGGKKEQAKPDPDADYLDDDEDYGLPEDIGADDEDGSDFDAEDDEPV
ncbi:CD1107 family mobile element protein [Enterocloster clostridioformis]|uniref:CD1107 family mobile element protein n=1 Tax=Enterocloster clostridioformis TaxID=1531 RepID=UPI0034A34FC3